MRRLLPRLTNLEEGCVVKANHRIYRIINVEQLENDKKFSLLNLDGYYSGYFLESKLPETFQVIGKSPMLNDVLEWVKRLFEYNTDKYEAIKAILFKYDWDFLEIYLKDQNHAIIDQLYEYYKECNRLDFIRNGNK